MPAALGFEYLKTRTNTGTATFGGSGVQFSIPNFGDFFHDMVVNITLAAVSCSAGTVPTLTASNIPSGGWTAGWTVGGSTSAGIVSNALQAELANSPAGTYNRLRMDYVNFQGTRQTFGAAATNYIRYCEYPGQRIFKKVKFEVSSNPLDEYDSNAMIFHQKFKVLPHKATGWKRLVGQEVPRDAYSDFGGINGTSRYPTNVIGLADNSTGTAYPAAPVNASNTARKICQVVDGPQTAKSSQPALDLWVPLTIFCTGAKSSYKSSC